MTSKKSLILKEILPEITNEISDKLKKLNRIDLLKQINELNIVDLCDCGDPDCGSFYTIDPRITSSDDIKHEGISISLGVIEVYDGKIGYIEIMPSEIGNRIKAHLNAVISNQKIYKSIDSVSE